MRAGNVVLDDVERRLPIPNDVIIDQFPLPSGNAWWVPSERVILLAPGLSKANRTFTLAHEAAHIVPGHHGAMPASIERDADRLAAVLLLGAVASASRRRSLRSLMSARSIEVPA